MYLYNRNIYQSFESNKQDTNLVFDLFTTFPKHPFKIPLILISLAVDNIHNIKITDVSNYDGNLYLLVRIGIRKLQKGRLMWCSAAAWANGGPSLW